MKRLALNRHTKSILKHAAGWFFIVVGVVMIITPGQGLLSILVGIYLLADTVPAFGRLKALIQRKFPKAAAYVDRRLHRRKKGAPTPDPSGSASSPHTRRGFPDSR